MYIYGTNVCICIHILEARKDSCMCSQITDALQMRLHNANTHTTVTSPF